MARSAWLGVFFLAGCMGTEADVEANVEALGEAQPPAVAGCSGDECVIDVAGSRCGDGSRSFIHTIDRPGTDDLFIYVEGGGACWDAVTCGCDPRTGVCRGLTATSLTRSAVRSHPWSTEPTSPVAGFDVVEIPYCTGDVHSGGRTANYGTQRVPMTVQHYGHENVRRSVALAHDLFPSARRIVVLGASAGGVGVEVNQFVFEEEFAGAGLHFISDSGTPLQGPQIPTSSLSAVLASWGTAANAPTGMSTGPDRVLDFGDFVAFNGARFPRSPYALVEDYHDVVMTSFSVMLGGRGDDLVQEMLLDTARDLRPQQKTFYSRGVLHVLSLFPNSSSEGVLLTDWVRAMIDHDSSWQSIQPPTD